MEKVENSDFSKLTENRIIVDNCEVEFKNSKIEFCGSGNVCYFQGGVSNKVVLDKCKFTFTGNNNLIFINASKAALKLIIKLGHGCNVYIGKELRITQTAHFMANEKSNIYVGEHCLFAKDVWFRTSNMHLIYDIPSRHRISHNQDIYVGDHVWLGQDVTCFKGTVLGDGSIVGMRSLCNGNKTQYINSIYSGSPAIKKRSNVTWRNKACDSITEEEVENGIYDELTDNKFIYSETKMNEKVRDFKKLKNLKTIEDRIAFFGGAVYKT